jgi:hypothetical protein
MKDRRSISRPMLLLGILVLTGLVVFVVVHVGEMERFALLLSHAEPAWLILAVILQAGTYLCAGVIWHEVTRPRANSVPARALFRAFELDWKNLNRHSGQLDCPFLAAQFLRS